MKRYGIIVILIASIFIFAPFAARVYALNTYWTGGTGSWHDPLNWDNGVPTLSNDAYIDNGGTAQISADVNPGLLYVGYNNLGNIEQTNGINT